jgi:hypothetical protein
VLCRVVDADGTRSTAQSASGVAAQRPPPSPHAMRCTALYRVFEGSAADWPRCGLGALSRVTGSMEPDPARKPHLRTQLPCGSPRPRRTHGRSRISDWCARTHPVYRLGSRRSRGRVG